MYRIIAINGEEKRVIYHPLASSFYVKTAQLNHEMNVFSVLTLELLQATDLNLNEYKTIFEVYEDATDKLVFRGRLITRERDMDAQGMLTNICEAECMLSLLNDICTRSYKKEKVKLSIILEYILNEYNKRASYKIKLGTLDSDVVIDEIDLSYMSCYEALTYALEEGEKELELIYNENSLTLNFKNQIGKDNGVQVRLGINMIDLLAQTNIQELCTRLIPICQAADEVITISSVNDGKDYLINETLEKQIGYPIERVEENPDEENKTKLKKWGQKKLNEYSKVDLNLNLNFVDLDFLNTKKASVSLGDTLNVYNPLLDIFSNTRVNGLTINLLEPHNPSIELSSRKRGLTDRVIELKTKNKNKSIINTNTYTILDNITPQNPLIDTVIINKVNAIKNAHIYLMLDRYTIYSEEGVIYDTYPKDVNVYVNDTLVSTLQGNTNEEATINIDGRFKEGTNKIKFTSTQKGRINAKVEISTNA